MLNDVIKKLDGKLLCIGINNKNISKTIEENKQITFCHMLTNDSEDDGNDGSNITINIRDINKKYKNIDNLIINLDSTKKYLYYFLKYLLILSTKKVIFYTKSKHLIDKVVSRANKFNYEIKIEEKNNKYILIINTKKHYKIKGRILFCIDLMLNEIDKVTDILIK